MDLERYIELVKQAPCIKKKHILRDALSIVHDTKVNTERIYKHLGEDAAAIFMGDKLLLVATDMIAASFIEISPQGAGFSAVLVSIDDIYACGGYPVAAAIDVQASTKERMSEMLAGVRRGSLHFGIPIVRGHTSIVPGNEAIASTVFGEINKEDYISAGGAREGDVLVLVWDPDGKRSPAGQYWDTVSFKDARVVQGKRKVMHELARARLVHASKDVSDAGIFGTALMMLNLSRVGCDFPLPGLLSTWNVDPGMKDAAGELYWWSTAYLTTGFLVAAASEHLDAIKEMSVLHEMDACVLGKIVAGSKLQLVAGGKKHELFDWSADPIFP